MYNIWPIQLVTQTRNLPTDHIDRYCWVFRSVVEIHCVVVVRIWTGRLRFTSPFNHEAHWLTREEQFWRRRVLLGDSLGCCLNSSMDSKLPDIDNHVSFPTVHSSIWKIQNSWNKNKKILGLFCFLFGGGKLMDKETPVGFASKCATMLVLSES